MAKQNGTTRRLSGNRVVGFVRKYLEPHQPKGFRLEVLDQAERQPDGWWYVFFRPTRANLRSYQYSDRVVETMLDLSEREGVDVVLLEASLTRAI